MPAYNVTVRLVDSNGTIIGGVVSAIMAAYNATFRVVDSNGLVIDSFGGGSSGFTPQTAAASPVAVNGGDVIFRGSTGASADQIANLPPATGSGVTKIIKKMDVSAFSIVVTAAGGDLIDGFPTFDVGPTQYASITIVDGAAGAWDVTSVKP